MAHLAILHPPEAANCSDTEGPASAGRVLQYRSADPRMAPWLGSAAVTHWKKSLSDLAIFAWRAELDGPAYVYQYTDIGS
jgi:hypothetical protein